MSQSTTHMPDIGMLDARLERSMLDFSTLSPFHHLARPLESRQSTPMLDSNAPRSTLERSTLRTRLVFPSLSCPT
jgi:hypothetical protein